MIEFKNRLWLAVFRFIYIVMYVGQLEGHEPR